LGRAKSPVSIGLATRKIRTLAKTPSKTLDTRSFAGPHKARRTLTDAYVQYQHPRGEGGGLEGEKREYRDVASAKRRPFRKPSHVECIYAIHEKCICFLYMLFVYAFEKRFQRIFERS